MTIVIKYVAELKMRLHNEPSEWTNRIQLK